MVSTPAPVMPLITLAPTPPKNAFNPCYLCRYLIHEIELVNGYFSPEDIIILLRTVSKG